MPTLTLRVTEAVTSPPTAIVYNDGLLTGGGTHATIAAAIAAAGPGSIIELRNRTPGFAKWVQTIAVNRSGAAGNPLTIRVRDGDSVMLSTSGTLLDITGSYVTVRGNSTGRGGLELGDGALWDAANKLTSWDTCYPHRMALSVSNCTNVTLENLTFHGGRSYDANVVYGTVTQFIMRNCVGSKHGTNYTTIGNSAGNDAGDLLHNNAKWSLMEDCELSLGGHEIYAALGPYQVHRRCTFNGDFTAAATGFPGTRTANSDGGIQSNRMPLNSWPGEWGPQLWEDCIFKNAGPSALNTSNVTYNPACKMQGFRPMYRHCYFYDCLGGLFNGAYFGDIGTATGEVMSRGYVYHVTAYNMAGIWNNLGNTVAAEAPNYVDDQREHRFVNNVFAEIANGRAHKGTLGVAQNLNVVVWNGANIPVGTYPNSWKGTVWRDNLFNGPADKMNFQLTGTGAVGGATVPVTNSTQWPANIYGNNFASTINFANPAARTKAGFAITSGPGYQDAAPLTTTVGSGTNATTLVVADAGYFYDGWGITGETGDYIKVGNNAPVRVTAVNWTTNTLTLSSPISWTNGAAVYFAGNDGAANAGTVFDNKGAAQ